MDPGSELKDITALPFFPYTPGLGEWLALGAAVLIAFYLASRKSAIRLRRSRLISNALRELRTATANLTQAPAADQRTALDRISQSAKRLVQLIAEADLTGLSCRELESLQIPTTPALGSVAHQIAIIDRNRYQPLFEAPEVQRAAHNVIEAIEELQQQLTSSAAGARS